MTQKKRRIACIQQQGHANKQRCLDETIQGIADAAKQGAELIVLQELHTSLYFCQTEKPDNFDLAETIPGPSTHTLSAIAKQHGVVIVASLFEKRSSGIYHNTAVVLEKDGSIAGKYRKMHIPHDPGFNEKYYFTPGDQGFKPIQTSVGNLGVLICWDQWFPEAARLMALAGADLLIYPTAIGWVPGGDPQERAQERDAWITIQRAHAVANSLPVVVCNRTGFEPRASTIDRVNSDPSETGNKQGIHFWGSSFITGVSGEILCEAPIDESAVLLQEVNLSKTDERRRLWPYFRDRRLDAYEKLLTHGETSL